MRVTHNEGMVLASGASSNSALYRSGTGVFITAHGSRNIVYEHSELRAAATVIPSNSRAVAVFSQRQRLLSDQSINKYRSPFGFTSDWFGPPRRWTAGAYSEMRIHRCGSPAWNASPFVPPFPIVCRFPAVHDGRP